MQSAHFKSICLRAVEHVLIIGGLWALAQYARWGSNSAFVKAVGLIVRIAPEIGGDLLDNMASRTLGIELPYPAWYHVAFVVGYAIVLAPIIWQPFRRKWMNYLIPVLLFMGCTASAFVVLAMMVHAK